MIDVRRVPDYCGGWPWDLGFNADPRRGVPVAYALFDVSGRVVWVGSSGRLRDRLRVHARTRVFASWVAWRCRTRDEASALEYGIHRRLLPGPPDAPARMAWRRVVTETTPSG